MELVILGIVALFVMAGAPWWATTIVALMLIGIIIDAN